MPYVKTVHGNWYVASSEIANAVYYMTAVRTVTISCEILK
jgi:hypothetical protein